MEGKEEDVIVGANKYSERQPIRVSAQTTENKDYKEPPPAPFFEPGELKSWSFYRAGIAEFVATFLFLYITILTVMGVVKSPSKCSTVGIQGIAWAFSGMIFALVYCTAGISGGHINPAVTFGLFLARKLSLARAVFYMIMQCLGAICGAGVVKGYQKVFYMSNGGGANVVAPGYTKASGLGAEIIGTFFLVYTVFSATDAKRNARDSHVPILAPLPIGFAVFLVHLETIPITGTGINPARSLGTAIIYNKEYAWDGHIIDANLLLEAPKNVATQYSQKSIQRQKHTNDGNDNKANKKSRLFNSSEVTPLNHTPENNYLATKNSEECAEPNPIRISDKVANSGKSCIFHNQFGHNTNEYRHLKNPIEELIRENRLQQYVKNLHALSPSTTPQGQGASNDLSGPSNGASAQTNPWPIVN